MPAGRELPAISQTALVTPTVTAAVLVTNLLAHHYVCHVTPAGWVRLVTTLASTARRPPWTVVSVYVRKVGPASDVTQNVLNMATSAL